MSSTTDIVATPGESQTTSSSGSSPITTPNDDSDYEDALEHNNDDDLAGVSSTIKDEEERIRNESKRKEEEEAKANEQKFIHEKSDEKDTRFKKLQFLIKQSTVYSSILMEKLTKQQEEQRERAEKADKLAQKAEDNAQKAEDVPVAEDDTPTKRQRNTRSKAPIEKSTKGKRTRGLAPKKENSNIAEMFSKADLTKAGGNKSTKDVLLAEGAEDDTLVTKPKPKTHSTRQPKLVTGAVMREYQLQGLEWLVSLYENGLNGILADEMGLGKTLQTISFIAFLKEKGIQGPFLVAAPLSTLSNWIDEFEKFTPEIPVLLYHGTIQEREELRNKRMRKIDSTYPIICTSYEIIMNDSKHLQRIPWKYIIIDEGHRLKNLNCRLIRELKSYDSANRLLLTGTPLQNNLSELWSLLNFLLPDIFDNLESFQSWFDFSALQEKGGHDKIIQQEAKSNLVSSLHQILKPFLLRRLKTDVETSLPKKREYILYAPLSQTQKDLYRKLLDHDAEQFLIDKIMSSQMARKFAAAPLKMVMHGKISRPGSDGTRTPNFSEGIRTPKRKADSDAEEIDTTKLAPAQALRSKHSSKKLRVNYKETSDREYFNHLEKSPEPESAAVSEADPVELAIRQATKEVRSKKMQNIVMQLRLACNSPHMFYWPWGDESPDEELVKESGKLMLLDVLVPALFEKGHKVLIFSQFTKMLDILEDWARELRGWNTCRIDGSVKQEDRREQIKSFNTDANYKLFLLSTRAGGLGINLTSADTVILFDSDWNPQQDLQAQDRAHRIGQTKPVIVYRLATAATVEQTLLEKADAKRRLEKLVIQKGKFRSLTSASSTGGGEDDLAKILGQDEFEKFETAKSGDDILSASDLKVLMDRSEEAYERAEKGEAVAGSNFKAVETKKVSEQDILAAM